MKRVEMVGPPGVGKTTLYNKICQIPMHSRSYQILKEAYKDAAINSHVTFSNLKLWFYQQLIKSGLLKSKSQGLGRTILEGMRSRRQQNKIERYESFMVAYNILLEYLKNRKNFYHSYLLIKSIAKKIDEYLLLNSSLSNNYFVLFDEGLGNCHPGITEYGVNTYTCEELREDALLNPAGIVSCEQSEDVVYKQALKRKKQGIHRSGQWPLDDAELKEHIMRCVQEHHKKVSLYEDIDIPVLHIDTRAKPSINISTINDFILDLKG